MKKYPYPRILLKVEKELEKDWEYHDWPQEAVQTVEKLAKELKKAINILNKEREQTSLQQDMQRTINYIINGG